MKKRLDNRIDNRLAQLVELGELEDTRKLRYLLYDQKYWDKFVSRCDDELVEYVLSLPQSGNWNGWLYAACEKRVGRKPNR